jgi:long-subunit fatty acid transport protein
MKYFFIICCVTLNFVTKIYAIEPINYAAKNAAMGNTGVVNKDVNSCFTNQAALAFLTRVHIGIGFQQKFMLSDLRQIATAIALPTKTGTIALSALHFGFDEYNHTKMGLGIGKKLSEKTSIGLQLNYLQQHISNEANLSAFTFEASMFSQVSKKVSLGFHMFNPYPFNRNLFQAQLPSLATIGLGWRNLFKPNFKTGLEYNLTKKFYLRGGIQSQPTLYSFGFGYQFNSLKIDCSNTIHAVLGQSPQFSLTYLLK